MKTLIPIVIGLLVVGCGKSEPLGSGSEYNAGLATDEDTTKAESTKEPAFDQGRSDTPEPFAPETPKPSAKFLETKAKAEAGDAGAQFDLGQMYALGVVGVQMDTKEAVKWYRKAAEGGIAKAQSIVGGCYANGDGVKKDFKEAVKWYRKAAEQGYLYAQENLQRLLKEHPELRED
jgi:TPR repeat protein